MKTRQLGLQIRCAVSVAAALMPVACKGGILGNGPGLAGSAGEGAGGTTTMVEAPACAAPELMPRSVRPLNATQYQKSLAAVFTGSEALTNPFSASDRSAEFSTSSSLRRFDFNASLLVIENGKALGRGAFAKLSTEHPCLIASADAACVERVVTSLGRALYRRPLTKSEASKLVSFFQAQQMTASGDAAVASDYLVRAMAASPRFLFRSELGVATRVPSQYALTPHEVASAIAYTLTDAPPDAQLAAAADAGLLTTPEQVREQGARVLASAEGVTGMLAFGGELLLTRDFPTVKKDANEFPLFDDATRADVYADYQDTVTATLRSATPTLSALLTTRDFITRPRTAALVGWQSDAGFAPEGTPFTTTEPGRLGILSHPVVMARFSHGDETNPVARGHLVSSKLLCASVPPPPMAVMFPQRLNDGVPRTLRMVLEQQHAVGSCAACHKLMDPMGYPFEVFDAVGRYRTEENGLPLDTTGVMTGGGDVDGPVQDAAEMIHRLASSTAVHDCVANSAMQYVTGADEPARYTCAQAAIARHFRERSGNIPELFLELLASETFLKRSQPM